MKKNCENCLNCIFKGYENTGGHFDGGIFEIHECIKGRNIDEYKRKIDCDKYVSKDDLTLYYIIYCLYSSLGLIITIGILILLLSFMPWFASVYAIILLIFGFWMKKK